MIIFKDASVGYEDHAPIMLQGHMDMVAEKELDSNHDFKKDPIELIVEGNILHANKTTLGADDGCGVCIMLALLTDTTLKHPPLECVFTVQEEVGLTVVDEPTTKGVDKYILEMELAETTKTKIDKFSVKSIQNAEKKPNEISDWINKINDLQKRKVPTTVEYGNKMPDVESLMQVWPEKEENCLNTFPFPDEKLNIPLDSYAKIVCNMVDIPVHKSEGKQSKSLIESLHVLFTLYSEFKTNQHFQNQKEDNKDFQSMKF